MPLPSRSASRANMTLSYVENEIPGVLVYFGEQASTATLTCWARSWTAQTARLAKHCSITFASLRLICGAAFFAWTCSDTYTVSKPLPASIWRDVCCKLRCQALVSTTVETVRKVSFVEGNKLLAAGVSKVSPRRLFSYSCCAITMIKIVECRQIRIAPGRILCNSCRHSFDRERHICWGAFVWARLWNGDHGLEMLVHLGRVKAIYKNWDEA